MYLEQSGDGQGSDTPVGVCDQVLQLHVTGRHCRWVLHGNLPNTVLIFVFSFDIDGHGNNLSCKFVIFVLPVKCLQSFTLQLF